MYAVFLQVSEDSWVHSHPDPKVLHPRLQVPGNL